MRKYVCDMNDSNLLLFEYDFLIVNLRFYYTFRELDVFKKEKKEKRNNHTSTSNGAETIVAISYTYM